MSRLIDELKWEHTSILSLLDEIREAGIVADESQDKLFAAKASLLTHLRKEDKSLYPALRRAAHDDEKLRRTIDLFTRDITDISKSALEFFATYSRSDSYFDFATDFGRLHAALKSRIKKEEAVLYPEYERLFPEDDIE